MYGLLPMDALLFSGLRRPGKRSASIGGMWSLITTNLHSPLLNFFNALLHDAGNPLIFAHHLVGLLLLGGLHLVHQLPVDDALQVGAEHQGPRVAAARLQRHLKNNNIHVINYLFSSIFLLSSTFLRWTHFFFQAVWGLGKELLPFAEGIKIYPMISLITIYTEFNIVK